MVACDNVPVLGKAGDKREIQGLLKFTLYHGIKKYLKMFS